MSIKMPNNTYLLASSTQGLTGPTSENILLQAAYHVPLVWSLGLASSDIKTLSRFDEEGYEYLVCGASVARKEFISRLTSRMKSARLAFAHHGDVSYHMKLFVDWLVTQTCEFICIDWTEYNFLNGDDHEFMIAAIAEAEIAPTGGVAKLTETSTVIEGTRFITLEQARAGDASQDEQYTFFRLLGDSSTISVPWS